MFLFLHSTMYITTSHSLLHWLSQLRCGNKMLQASLWHKFSYTANSRREQEGLSLNLDKVGRTCRIPAGCRRGRTTSHLHFFVALFGKKKKKHYHLSQCQPAWPPSLTNQYSCTIFRLSQPKIHQAKHHPVPVSCLLLNPVPVDSIHSYKKKKQRVRLWDRTLIRPTKTGYV